MKFLNVFVACLIFIFGSLVITNGIIVCKQLDDKFKNVIAEQSREEFIAESFKNTCAGEGFEDLNQWQINCREMFDLEYIAWSDAEDFMNVSMINTNTKLFYGVWKQNGIIKEVYCREKRI